MPHRERYLCVRFRASFHLGVQRIPRYRENMNTHKQDGGKYHCNSAHNIIAWALNYMSLLVYGLHVGHGYHTDFPAHGHLKGLYDASHLEQGCSLIRLAMSQSYSS